MSRVSVCTLVVSSLILFEASGSVLEPEAGQAVHCGGQDPIAFSNYSSFMGQNSAPAVFMTYCGLRNLDVSFFMELKSTLSTYKTFIVPQIGLSLPSGDDLRGVANGTFNHQIGQLVEGLIELDRPAYIRVGYEFNGQWNNYPPESYRSAWPAIVDTVRENQTLKKRTAFIWDFSCDASDDRLDWMQWLPPAQSSPDWWGVNIFSGESLANSSCIAKYVAAAAEASQPVALGESTPRGYGVLDEPWMQIQSGADNDLCLGVKFGSTADGSALTTWTCGTSSDKLWRLNSDGYLINIDGKCVGVNSSAEQRKAENVLVITECGGSEPGPTTLHWLFSNKSGSLETPDGQCLMANTSAKATQLLLGSCNGPLSTWHLLSTDNGGGILSWNEWFEPYLALIAHPSVKLFCYIDWFWPAKSNHQGFNWYNWGDARVELPQSSFVGGKWKTSMDSGSVIHASSEADFCRKLGCI